MTSRPTRTVKGKAKPKSLSVRIKLGVNAVSNALIGRSIFSVGIYDLFGAPPKWQQQMGRRWHVFSRETNFPYAFGLLIFCLIIIGIWRSWAPGFQKDIWIEFWGLTFDVIFILIVFALFEHRRQRMQRIQTQHDIIEDYKRWDSEEARFRLAGAIRRLNRMGVYAVNFSGARISDFSFANNNIGSLNRSIFYDGSWGQPLAEGSVILTKVSFDHVDCQLVQFSPFDPFGALGIDLARYARINDCTFVAANLEGATFNGASLKWSDLPPASHCEFDEDPETGQAFSMQVSYGPFDRAELTGVSFARSAFVNADFRGAQGVLEANFSEAKGLESATFDDDATKQAVLANASKIPTGSAE